MRHSITHICQTTESVRDSFIHRQCRKIIRNNNGHNNQRSNLLKEIQVMSVQVLKVVKGLRIKALIASIPIALDLRQNKTSQMVETRQQDRI